MSKQSDYYALYHDLMLLEKKTGLYLADETVDNENVTQGLSEENYWEAMINSAQASAGQRASDHGYDINLLIGRIIY